MASPAKVYRVQIAITHGNDCLFLKSLKKSNLWEILDYNSELPTPMRKLKPGAYTADLHVLHVQTVGWGGEPAEWDLRLSLSNIKKL